MNLEEYAEILERRESQLTEEEKRLMDEAADSASSVLSTPFVSLVEDEIIDVVGVSSPPLTASTASTSCSSRLTGKQVVPKKCLKTEADIDMTVTSPHIEKKKAPKKRAPKQTVEVPKTITIIPSSSGKGKKRAAPVNSVHTSDNKRVKPSPLLSVELPPPPTTTTSTLPDTLTYQRKL